MTSFRRVDSKFISENCSKNCLGKLSNNSCRRMSTDCFRELSNNSPRRVVHEINYRSMSTIYASEGCPQSKQIYLFGNNFHTWHKHVRESVRTRGMGLGMSTFEYES